MAYRTVGMDRVMEVSSAPPGTIGVSLGGAVAGYRTFASVTIPTAMAVGDTFAYFIEAVDGSGSPSGLWERGFGAYAAGNTVTRGTVVDGSSGPGVPVNFTTSVRIGCAPMTDTTIIYPAPGGRLSTISGGPATDGGTGGATTIYYSQYMHNRIPLWNGNGIQVLEFTAVPLVLNAAGAGGPATAGLGYDVFAFINASGNVALEMFAWANATARTAVSIAWLNGFVCKQNDPTRRYIGSFYCSVAGTTYDYTNGNASSAGGKRFIWNYNNRLSKNCSVWDGTASWNPTATGWQLYRGLAVPNNCLEFFRGANEDAVSAGFTLSGNLPQGTQYYSTIGLDITTGGPNASSAGIFSNNIGGTSSVNVNVATNYGGMPGGGYHYLSMVVNPSATTVGLGATYGLPALNATMMC